MEKNELFDVANKVNGLLENLIKSGAATISELQEVQSHVQTLVNEFAPETSTEEKPEDQK